MSEDLRSIKTEKALYAAISSLLKKCSFKKMTIKGICEEALISRAAFYAHFIDKYDLLKHWMAESAKDMDINATYDRIEKVVNCFVHDNALMLRNLVDDADNETFDVLFDFMLSMINLTVEKNDDGEIYPKSIVSSHFYAGGMISYFMWHVKNKFPTNVPPMNRHLYEMIMNFKAGNQNQEQKRR